MNLIIHGLIPLLLLAFLNTNVLLSLRRVRQEMESSQLREVVLARVSCIIVLGQQMY